MEEKREIYEQRIEGTVGKRRKSKSEMSGTEKAPRSIIGIEKQLTGVEDDRKSAIEHRDVVSKEVTDDVMRDDEDWGDKKDIEAENGDMGKKEREKMRHK